MQGPTHRDGGTAAALGGYLLLQTGVIGVGSIEGLSADISAISPLLGLVVMYPFAVWGSTAPDLDHEPGSVWDDLKPGKKTSGHTIPSKDIVSRNISYILHLGKRFRTKHGHSIPGMGALDCKHRSWQTHSEVPLLLCLLAFYLFSNYQLGLSSYDIALANLVVYGLGFGFVAHLFLDLLTPEGLPFATGILINRIVRAKVLPEKIKVVPHVKPKVKGEPGFFSTGGKWEVFIFWILRVLNLVLLSAIVYRSVIS